MTVETTVFDAGTVAVRLVGLGRRGTPVHVRISLEGAVATLTPVVEVTLAGGLVVDARAGDLEGARAVARVFLADRAWIETATLDVPRATGPRVEALVAEAEALAASLSAPLFPIGGLGAVLAPDVDRLMLELPGLPDAVGAVLRLADGARTAAAILRDSAIDEALTARILERLSATGILRPAEGAVPSAPPSDAADAPLGDEGSALPSEDELEGSGVEEDIGRWLAHEHVPEALLSAEGFERAFALVGPDPTALPHPAPADTERPHAAGPTPRELTPREPTPREPTPREPTPRVEPRARTQDRAPRPASSPGADGRPPNRAVLAGALVVLVVLVGVMGWLTGRAPEPPRATEAAAPDASVLAVATASTAAVTERSASGATILAGHARVLPPIAGPNAPEEVKRAERLVDAAQYWEAGRLLAHLRDVRPEDPAVWVLSGQLDVDSGGRFARAEEFADRAIARDPRFYRAWVLKGSVQQFLGRRGQAAAAYRRALALEPDHPMSAELRAVVAKLESLR